MALRKKVDAPQFESEEIIAADAQMEQAEVNESEVVEVQASTVEDKQPEAQVTETATETETTKQADKQTETVKTQKETKMTKETTTAVAAKPLNAVATVTSAPANPTGSLEWVITQEEVSSFGPGTFPKVTANNAGTLEIDREDLDKSIEVRVLSVNPRFALVPGVDGDEASKLVRYSYDGVTVENSEMNVEEYLTFLREEEGYTKADMKTYADLWVNILGHEDVDESEIVQIQLSPQSVGQWNALRTKMNFAQRRGTEFNMDDLRLRITGERKKNGSTTWGIMKFDLA